MPSHPDVVTVHLWGVRRRDVPAALLRMALDRGPLRRTPGLQFAKLVGTGDGRTFTVRDADPNHWGLVATWSDGGSAEAFERGPVARSWGRLARERLRVTMRPLASRGAWAGRHPFGDTDRPGPRPGPHDGPVAAITRARLDPRRARTFWRSVPAVTRDLHDSPGLRLAVGIGEAPVGLQGTFSLWDSADALTAFAYGRAAHRDAVRRTAEVGWYREELFARFAVLDVTGTFAGRTP